MREITITLYEFDELPTEEAKLKARNKARDFLAMDPPWRAEHDESWEAARKIYDALPGDLMGSKLADWIRENVESKFWEPAVMDGTCPLTGYCADAEVLAQLVAFMEHPDEALGPYDLLEWAAKDSDRAWNKDLESQMSDESIDEHIRANEYEFTKDGKRA